MTTQATAPEDCVRQGLQEIAQGPSLAVFGAVAYDPLAPWVVVDEQADRPSFRLRK